MLTTATRNHPAGLDEFPAAGDTALRFLAKCSKCGQRHAMDVAEPWASTFHALTANGFPEPGSRKVEYLRCLCGRALTMWRCVNGRPSEKKCDARCTSAIGPSCDCSCSGRNHGSDHL